jgi:NADPH2:quinone reductase
MSVAKLDESTRFKAFRATKNNGDQQVGLTTMSLAELDAGDVVIEARYSSINYKDALGATGEGKIYRKYPINGGIDVAGVVAASERPDFAVGDPVLVTGCGLGESQDGGYAEYVRVPADWVIPCPEGLSLEEAMIFGTAGFTAGLCLHRLLVNDQTPDKGPIVVTGASGGVGSLAIPLLVKQGFEVIAVTGKAEAHDHLRSLGAHRICSVAELELGQRPLEKAKFGGAIDNVGGPVLEGLIRHTNLWGNIACVGLAADHRFSNTVMPFILRGVSLLGISSANCPRDIRESIWQNLATSWKPDQLHDIVHKTIPLDDLDGAFRLFIDRKVIGRTLVKIR